MEYDKYNIKRYVMEDVPYLHEDSVVIADKSTRNLYFVESLQKFRTMIVDIVDWNYDTSTWR